MVVLFDHLQVVNLAKCTLWRRVMNTTTSVQEAKTEAKPRIRPVKSRAQKKAESKQRTQRQAKPKDQFGFREGSKQSKAAHMYFQGDGATTEEVKKRLGGPHLNLLKDVRKRGVFDYKESFVQSPKSRRNVKKYKIFKVKKTASKAA